MVIDLKDFNSIETQVAITNTTTGTQAKSPVNVVEFLKQGLILQLPMRSCSKGHNLVIDLQIRPIEGAPISFKSTAKVEDMESMPTMNTDQAVITLTQFKDHEWASVQKVFSARQDEILAFFKSAKGF